MDQRAQSLFLPPPFLASSILRFLLRRICLASSFFFCLTSSALPRFHPPSLPRDRPRSMSPFHPDGSSCKASRSYVISISFTSSTRCSLVSHKVCLNHFLKKAPNEQSPETIFTRFKYQTVETIRIFYKLPVVAGFYHHRQVPPCSQSLQFRFPTPNNQSAQVVTREE